MIQLDFIHLFLVFFGLSLGGLSGLLYGKCRFDSLRDTYEDELREIRKEHHENLSQLQSNLEAQKYDELKQAEQRFFRVEETLRKRLSQHIEQHCKLAKLLEEYEHQEFKEKQLENKVQDLRCALKNLTESRNQAVASYKSIKKSYNRRNQEIADLRKTIEDLESRIQQKRSFSFIASRHAAKLEVLNSTIERVLEECRITLNRRSFTRKHFDEWLQEAKEKRAEEA